jgi:hypothetical protein
VSSATNPNSVEHTISTGDGQSVNYGAVSNTENVSATISLDKSSYKSGESPVVTVNDGEANVDPNAVNTIQITVFSTSDSAGIPLVLTETGPNTGVFQGAFSFTNDASSSSDGTIKVSTGDELGINYIGTHPRLDLEISGVQQGGSVDLTQVDRPIVENPPFLLGAAVEITYGPTVQLAPHNIRPECPDLGDLCQGTMNLEMSYANIPLCVDTTCQIPEALTVWQYLGPDIGWIDLRDFQPPGTAIQVDPDTKTVSAFTPFKGGILSLGISLGGGGGAGGGLGLAGAGIVLDLAAPIVADTPSSPPASGGDSAETNSQSNDDESNTETSSSTTSTENNNTAITQSTQTSGVKDTGASSQQSGAALAEGAISMNKTVAVPGIGNVTLSSSNLDKDRDFQVVALKESDLNGIKVAKSGSGDMTVSTQNGTKYDLVGPVLSIGPDDLEVNGTLIVRIPYNSTMVPSGGNGEAIRFVYYSGSSWEDVTVAPFGDGKFVTGTIADIGPVVAGVKSG